MRREEGVSPVIAEILMIAITVVLVTSLYLFVVGGYLSTPYNVDQLHGYLTFQSTKSNKTTLYFSISLSSPQSTYMENVKITIDKSGKLLHLNYLNNFIWSNKTSNGKWHYEAKLIDNDDDGKFSNGDTLIVYVVDDNPSDNITPPPFQSGDKVLFSINGYNGVSSGGVINF
ncbi:type IV pilin [Candidatus Aciduliprofundum boonei]|uniref:Archaeal Type IV pilin N-terminal domain-containing protein n=1 Tax=Aciduliprofundum boonei (strain DSM 19572 / T469) TaxID=439481 RepID=B5IA14_ACIB4|nr:type IV pilin [Candidatus Aciduliprofundum boonei]ADD08351.1 hypothetical protein Aboo_0540 [Aciduliprofundum boonei T469]EDY36093.1 archaeal flagellin N-terminal-like domain protein [Aciduliprofundum boonei T469]EDY37080.1 archaeal flagellin N-terminal-like domain protein [Aciduliprofundum boonei T469]HII54695.1 type IV pilin [Candidatus Aciduliprofundum boonei]